MKVMSIFKTKIFSIIFIVFFLQCYEQALAETICVSQEPSQDCYDSIQDAINDSNEGDEIVVKQGTYLDNIEITVPHYFKLRSERGPENCIIDGGNTDNVIKVMNNNVVHIEGFTIKNGNALSGAGIYCYYGSPTIKNCIISNNKSGYGGGGIYLDKQSHATIINCEISNNSINCGGGGIGILYSSPVISNCLLHHNDVLFGGGGIYSEASSFIITNCTITENTSIFGPGGVMSQGFESENPTLLNSILWNNGSYEILDYDGFLIVRYCDISQEYQGEFNLSVDPLFVNPLDNNYRLKDDIDDLSPCINAGNNENSIGEKDLDHYNRIMRDTVDMGAYETPIHVPSIKYESIQDAIDNAFDGDTILVAPGIYPGNIEFDHYVIDDKIIDLTCEASLGQCTINCLSESRGIFFNQNSSTIRNFIITEGYTSGYGAGILCNKASPTIDNCIIQNCNADIGGGGMFCKNDSSPIIKNCTFKNNKVTSGESEKWQGTLYTFINGGGIYCYSASTPLIQNCVFDSNQALHEGELYRGYGAGIYCKHASPTIKDCIIKNNRASTNGAGFYARGNSSPVIEGNTLIFNNSSLYGAGAGFYNLSENTKPPKILGDQVHIFNNSASYGGGICIYTDEDDRFENATSPVLSGCHIYANTAVFHGGGIYSFNSAPEISFCQIHNNTVTDGTLTPDNYNYYFAYGGGIYYINNSAGSLANSVIYSNTVGTNQIGNHKGYGGGVACNNSSLTITNCVFKNNTSKTAGGGFYSKNDSLLNIKNTLIIHNESTYGGGVCLYTITQNVFPLFANCTISDNTANVKGIEIYAKYGFAEIFNSIIWNEDVKVDDYKNVISEDQSVLDITSSAIIGGYTGNDNIADSPLFIEDYHLQTSPILSPCIDTGNNDAPIIPETDKDGNCRICDGDNDGEPIIDMGVYEIQDDE